MEWVLQRRRGYLPREDTEEDGCNRPVDMELENGEENPDVQPSEGGSVRTFADGLQDHDYDTFPKGEITSY